MHSRVQQARSEACVPRKQTASRAGYSEITVALHRVRYSEMTASVRTPARDRNGSCCARLAMMKTRAVLSIALLLLALPGCNKKKNDDAPRDSAKSTEPTEGAGAGEEAKPADSTPLRIAGAANLVKVMEEIVPRFEKANAGVKVDFIPGSSGKLAAQLKEGAPFDLFMSANVKFVERGDLRRRVPGRHEEALRPRPPGHVQQGRREG